MTKRDRTTDIKKKKKEGAVGINKRESTIGINKKKKARLISTKEKKIVQLEM
jgi:hypothetical protein